MPERGRIGDLLYDHAIVAGQDLDALAAKFADVGLEPEYGGEHAHDVTHNSLLGFDDGSYVELISTSEAGAEPSRRRDFIAGDAGPCGWALETNDVHTVAERMRNRGIKVELSEPHQRETPDGRVAKWQLAYLGGGEPGSGLPFVIEDRSRREYRISPSPSVAGTEVTGVAATIVCVADLDAGVERYRKAFCLSAPERQTASAFGADLAGFGESAVVLATPVEGGDWLDKRLDAFGTLPCAILLTVDDLSAAFDRFGIEGSTEWFGREVGWTTFGGGAGGRFGVIES
jgi:hypothetical protein